MAELDFSKIFAQTASSKADFTDENYMRGWGYLGSTPPPYQLFDYLQSQNDKKAKYLYDRVMESDSKFVKKNGDTMTGNLAVNNGTEFSAVEVDNTTGGKLLFESMAQNASAIGHIIYRNGSNTEAKLTIPKKTGDLITSEDFNPLKELVGFGGIVAQKLDTQGYFKYANGVIEQWGLITINVDSWTYNFPIAFEDKCYSAQTTDTGGKTYVLGFDAISNTQFTITREHKGTDAVTFWWRAIGK